MSLCLPHWAEWLRVPLAPDRLPVRHRVLYGGRGGGKSWTIAAALVLRAYEKSERVLCLREYQNSIRDSSKRLIEDMINRLGLGPGASGFFTFTDGEIRGSNGSVFSFLGLNGKEHSIKSLEGYTLAWVEEASTVFQASIDALIPTIRHEGSEIWWSFNPRFQSDPVDQLFRGAAGAPPGSIVKQVQWRDNPWFPEVLARDKAYDQHRDPAKHEHIWEGGYVQRSEAIVFKNWSVVPFEVPDEAVLRFGADWGYSQDPTVLVRCFLGRWESTPGNSAVIPDPNGRCLFIDFEAYMVGCEIDDIPALFAGSDTHRPPRWLNQRGNPGIDGAKRWQITADTARADTISHMRRRGFNIVAAVKGKGSVEDGISFLQSYDIYVHPRCRHTIAELTHYSWKVDKLTGEIFPKLVDENNHVIDALRYALEGVRRAGTGRVDFMSANPRMSLGAYSSSRAQADDILPGLEGYVHPSGGWGSVPGVLRALKHY